MPLGGGAVTTLASVSGTTYALAVDAENVYWAAVDDPQTGFENGAIMKVPLTGGTPVALATTQGAAAGVATDGSSVYWVDVLGGVKKVAVGGGAITTLATTNISAPASIAVDDTSVYWTNQDPNSLPGNLGTVVKLTPK